MIALFRPLLLTSVLRPIGCVASSQFFSYLTLLYLIFALISFSLLFFPYFSFHPFLFILYYPPPPAFPYPYPFCFFLLALLLAHFVYCAACFLLILICFFHLPICSFLSSFLAPLLASSLTSFLLSMLLIFAPRSLSLSWIRPVFFDTRFPIPSPNVSLLLCKRFASPASWKTTVGGSKTDSISNEIRHCLDQQNNSSRSILTWNRGKHISPRSSSSLLCWSPRTCLFSATSVSSSPARVGKKERARNETKCGGGGKRRGRERENANTNKIDRAHRDSEDRVSSRWRPTFLLASREQRAAAEKLASWHCGTGQLPASTSRFDRRDWCAAQLLQCLVRAEQWRTF